MKFSVTTLEEQSTQNLMHGVTPVKTVRIVEATSFEVMGSLVVFHEGNLAVAGFPVARVASIERAKGAADA